MQNGAADDQAPHAGVQGPPPPQASMAGSAPRAEPAWSPGAPQGPSQEPPQVPYREDSSESQGLGASTPKSATTSETFSRKASPHYDPDADVVIRFEAMGKREMKVLVLSVWAATLLGVVLLIITLWLKLDKNAAYFWQEQTVPVINVSFASVCVAALLSCWLVYARRLLRLRLSGKRWSYRRRRSVQQVVAELSVQLVNAVFFLLPNAYLIVPSHHCGWFDGIITWSSFVRWTCWNFLFLLSAVAAHGALPTRGAKDSRADRIVMDLSWVVHWPKLVIWLLYEGLLVALSVLLYRTPASAGATGDPEFCLGPDFEFDCSMTTAQLVLVNLVFAGMVGWWLLYVWYIRAGFMDLRSRPYSKYKMANITLRFQMRLRSLAFSFFVLSCAVSFYVEFNSCGSYIVSWLGLLPMQVVMSAVACAYGYAYMPKRPADLGILQVWLQEFSWTEKDVPRKRAERTSSLPPESSTSFCMDCEPMFCFETCVKLVYWSFLVYDYEEVTDSPFDVNTALALWDLEHFELFWEKSLDTKAIIGFNDDIVVIAFRGTASLKNAVSDMQVWRMRYPPGQGSAWTFTAPRVHGGFLKSYQTAQFNERLIARVEHILYRCRQPKEGDPPGGRRVKVYVTGHSLGGALATLCAYDIKKRCPYAERLIDVSCYTFGAPRTGNHAWVHASDAAVRDSWHVINQDDAVTRAGKFWALYKRAGHRVLINSRGDMVVRPSSLEQYIYRSPTPAGSVGDHYLTSYQRSLAAVVAAQFGEKACEGGDDGVRSLLAVPGVRDAFRHVGAAFRDMRLLELLGLAPPAPKMPAGLAGEPPPAFGKGLPQWCAPLFCLPRRAVRVAAPDGEGGAAPAEEQPIFHEQRLQCRQRGQPCGTTTVCQGVPRDADLPGLGAVEEAPQQPAAAPAQQAAGSAAQERPSSSTRGRDAGMPALVFQRIVRRPRAG